jgi:hypothetical protein
VFYDDVKRRKSTTQELQQEEKSEGKESEKEKTINTKKDLEKLAALGQFITRDRRALRRRPMRSRTSRWIARFRARPGHDAA